MDQHSPRPRRASGSTASPASSAASSPGVFFGRKKSQHELRTLARLHHSALSLWDAAPTPVRKVIKKDSREFHRRKTLLLSPASKRQHDERLASHGDSDLFASHAGSDRDSDSESESPRPFSFTFSLGDRGRNSLSASPASSVASCSSSVRSDRYREQAHCDLTFDFERFVFDPERERVGDQGEHDVQDEEQDCIASDAVGAKGIEEQVDPSDVESCAIRTTQVGKIPEIEHVEQEDSGDPRGPADASDFDGEMTEKISEPFLGDASSPVAGMMADRQSQSEHAEHSARDANHLASPSPPSPAKPIPAHRTPSAAELASMVADDSVGLAELAAAVAAINMRCAQTPPRPSPCSELDSPLPIARAQTPSLPSPCSELDSPLPIARAGPVIIPAILNRHPIRDCGRSPYRELPSPVQTPLPNFSPAREVVPSLQLATMDSPTPASELLASPTVQAITARATPNHRMITHASSTPLASHPHRPALIYPPKSKILKSSTSAIFGTPAQRSKDKRTDTREQAIRGQLTAAVSTIGQRTQAMSAPRPPRPQKTGPAHDQDLMETPRSMPTSRLPLHPPMSASRSVLAPRTIQQPTSCAQRKLVRPISQLPKPVAKPVVADLSVIKKPIPVPAPMPVRSAVSVGVRPALALGAPSRLVGSRQVQASSGKMVTPSPARRAFGAGREPVYSTYKPANSFAFTATCVSEPLLEASLGAPATEPSRIRGSSDDASSVIPVSDWSSPVKPPPLNEEPAPRDTKPKHAARPTRTPRAAAQAAKETLAPSPKPRRQPPNLSEKELKTKTQLNTTRNQVYFCAINRIIVRRDGERPPSPSSKIRTIADRDQDEKKTGRLERAKRRRRASGEGSSSDEEDDAPALSRLTHRRGPGDVEDYVTPARPAKRARMSPDAGSSSDSSHPARPVKNVTWDKALVVIPKSTSMPSEASVDRHSRPKSCLSSRGKLALDQHGNLASTGRPLAEILKRTRIDVTAVFYDGEEPVPPKVTTGKKKGKK